MNQFIPAEEYCSRVFDGTHDTPKPSSTGYPLLTSKNIKNRTLDYSGSYLISESDYNAVQKRSYVSQWDVLFSMIGTVGNAYIEQSDDIPYAVKNVGVFSCLEREKALWLYYYLQSPAAQKHIERFQGGAVQKFLSLGALRNFPVPEYSSQKPKQIKVLSTLDAKIELNNRINGELEAMAKLLYDYWFVQFDFPMTAAQATALGQPELEGKPYKTSGGKMVFNPTLKRDIPEGWEAGTLDKLGEVIGGSTPSKANDDYFCTEGIPWITPKDLSDNKGKKFIQRGGYDVSEEGKKAASLKVMPAGTVLLSSRAPIGYTAIASNPLTTNQGFKSFVSNRGFGSDYVYRTLNHFMKLIEQNASGSTFKEISGGTLKAIKIPFPNHELEKEYAQKVSPISSQQQNLEKQNQELTELRDWLLPMLMNGQVTVK